MQPSSSQMWCYRRSWCGRAADGDRGCRRRRGSPCPSGRSSSAAVSRPDSGDSGGERRHGVGVALSKHPPVTRGPSTATRHSVQTGDGRGPLFVTPGRRGRLTPQIDSPGRPLAELLGTTSRSLIALIGSWNERPPSLARTTQDWRASTALRVARTQPRRHAPTRTMTAS
jgi:hypothetical protein